MQQVSIGHEGVPASLDIVCTAGSLCQAVASGIASSMLGSSTYSTLSFMAQPYPKRVLQPSGAKSSMLGMRADYGPIMLQAPDMRNSSGFVTASQHH
eukprot:scaffold103220_cov15-Tisochrysis_lutea.AAC.1